MKALVYLENYFQVPYGLSKIDLIGIADFGIGKFISVDILLPCKKCI